MILSTLLKKAAPIRINGVPAADIAPGPGESMPWRRRRIGSLHYRAQEVRPGGLFVAIPGLVADGHDFIGTAVEQGASAVVSQLPVPMAIGHAAPDTAPIFIQVENSRKALASISAAFYGNPAETLCIVGITGTNGKTTTAYLVESVLKQAGFQTGVIGTINYHYNGKSFKNPVTTPESLDLQRILSDMHNDGVTHVVMEASSHAIDLGRIDGCWMDVGVFTNLTRDHLDYHRDMETYWDVKRRLFMDHLSASPKRSHARAVVNCNDPKGRQLLDGLPVPAVTVGYGPDKMIWPVSHRNESGGLSGRISTPGGELTFDSALVGKHNLENILCTVGVGYALNIPLETIKNGLTALGSVPGRLEPIENKAGRLVYVDYAHTPDALKNVISALREVAAQKIICVFGCGGDRDKGKRPRMGEIAGTLCDLTVITSDNPRSETPGEIIDQIVAGVRRVCSKAFDPSDLANGFDEKGYVVEPDRKKAIGLGIGASRPGDMVLIAGKGHETYQILGGRTLDFDDRKVARAAMLEIG